jgi:cytoskeletal protein CcmA (bactofilin family)
MDPQKDENQDLSSLEEASTVVENDGSNSTLTPPEGSLTSDAIDASGSSSGQSTEQPSQNPSPKYKGPSKIRVWLGRFNIYLLLFILVVLIAIIVTGLSIYSGTKKNDKKVTASQTLSSDTLKQIANSDATIGDPKQVLNVQSNAVFGGKVLIRDSLEVAGPIKVGGSLSLPGITVSGNSNFDQVQIRNTLSVGGDASIQGQLAVQKSLSVAAGATFGGAITATQISTNNLQITGDLVLTHHVVAGGPTPSRSNGAALGSGGTSSVNGSDTAGTVNINTGSGTAAGCFATVNFTQRYSGSPHILITPVGSAAGGIAYYVDRTTSSFSICTAAPAPGNQSFAFDYFVVD